MVCDYWRYHNFRQNIQACVGDQNSLPKTEIQVFFFRWICVIHVTECPYLSAIQLKHSPWNRCPGINHLFFLFLFFWKPASWIKNSDDYEFETRKANDALSTASLTAPPTNSLTDSFGSNRLGVQSRSLSLKRSCGKLNQLLFNWPGRCQHFL